MQSELVSVVLLGIEFFVERLVISSLPLQSVSHNSLTSLFVQVLANQMGASEPS